MKNKYRCVHCKQIVERESDKKWIESYCVITGRYVRLQLVTKDKFVPDTMKEL